VDNSACSGAPVVYDDHPSHANLVGRVEHLAELGSLVTDFRLIRAGDLHRANGGYLIIDARKVITQPLAWDELKRALRSRQIRIESMAQTMGLTTTASLDPEPIPLDLKVVLVGERLIYYLLAEHDPEFLELFKVAADFDEIVPRDADTELLFARLLGTLARREGLRPLDPGGVARAIEHGARLAADAERLSVHSESLADVLREADHVAAAAGRPVLTGQDVRAAIDAQRGRAGRLHERIVDEIRRGTILIDTSGARVGQVNGLSVLQLGPVALGRPSRITASVRLGSGRVVDIEREVELGGPIHSKGVMILAGFVGARYTADRPLSLHASLVFEQSYSGVEGDSASCAELCALLSALAEVPIRQSLAVTGSVNQHGEVQAVGGVNEKIEGFYDLCAARGLSGDQGVIIPASNVKHLMLRDDVVEAVEVGRFRVWGIETVDQALELLTGTSAGARDDAGRFPDGSVNQRVESRLEALAEKARSFGGRAEGAAAPPGGAEGAPDLRR
jgi:lon-related putative ATP-dependent protease